MNDLWKGYYHRTIASRRRARPMSRSRQPKNVDYALPAASQKLA